MTIPPEPVYVLGHSAAELDPTVLEVSERARCVATEISELARDVRAYSEALLPDPDRLQTLQLVRRFVEGVGRRQSTLVHRRRGQRREADHVTHRIDMRNRGLTVIIDHESAALVGRETGQLQLESRGVALPSGRMHHHLSRDAFARGQGGDRAAAGALDRGDLFAEPEGHGVVA